MRNWYQEKAIEWAEYALDEKYKTDAIEDMQKSIMYQKKADDCVYDPVGEFIGNIVDGTKNALHSMTKIETWVGQPAAMWLKMRKK